MPYVTDEIKSLIGKPTQPIEAFHAVEPSEVRRFHHATMDPAPRYMDAEFAKRSRYGGLVAPPAFPVLMSRRQPDESDPLDAMASEHFDGLSRSLRPGLPAIDVPLKRLLNGGYEYEFYRYALQGERVLCTSSYRDIYERDGKNGVMVFIILEDLYTTSANEQLLRAINTIILR